MPQYSAAPPLYKVCNRQKESPTEAGLPVERENRSVQGFDTLLGLCHEAFSPFTVTDQAEREERDAVYVVRRRFTPRRLLRRLGEELALTNEGEVDVVHIVVVAVALHEFGQECHDLGHRRLAENPREAGFQHFGGDVGTQAHGFVPVGHIGLVDHPEHLRCQLPMREAGHVGGVLTQLGEVFKEVHRPSCVKFVAGLPQVLNIYIIAYID